MYEPMDVSLRPHAGSLRGVSLRQQAALAPHDVGTLKAALAFVDHTTPKSPPQRMTWHSSPTERTVLAPTDERGYLAHVAEVLDAVDRRARAAVVDRFLTRWIRGWRCRRAVVRDGVGMVLSWAMHCTAAAAEV